MASEIIRVDEWAPVIKATAEQFAAGPKYSLKDDNAWRVFWVYVHICDCGERV